MTIPDDLRLKMTLYREQGHIVGYGHGLFLQPSWLAVYHGQRILPKIYSPQADLLALDEIDRLLSGYRRLVQKGVAAMPDHASVITRQCGMCPLPVPPTAMSLYGGIAL